MKNKIYLGSFFITLAQHTFHTRDIVFSLKIYETLNLKSQPRNKPSLF